MIALRCRASLLSVLILWSAAAWAQANKPAPDPLGRETPRGTVIGFITAAREGKSEIAAQYLQLDPKSRARELSNQLYTILNGRLPARLNRLSDRAEGSLANPLKPDQETVGVIQTSHGEVSIVLERVAVKNGGPIWLFSKSTLEWVPDVYDEIDLVSLDRYLPKFLSYRIAGIRLFDWLMLLVALPVLYRVLGAVDRLASPRLTRWARRVLPGGPIATWLPGSVRLVLLAIVIRVFVPSVDLPLAERRLWAMASAIFAIVGAVGLLLRGVDRGERYLLRRARRGQYAESQALLRLLRRVAQGLLIAAGVVVALEYFGFDPSAALAGLGIGGIAVALAAQKTLENVVGGFSLVFDKAVRVGDFLKIGETIGTVDHVGLRSTQIRTLDRTVVSVPNGQMAVANIETLSRRDKFWFHHVVGLSYATTASQMRGIASRLEKLLHDWDRIEVESVRVRFIRFGAYSLDLELFAYVGAADWEAFLVVQQDLLLHVMDVIENAGASIAFPTQTVHFDMRSAGDSPHPAADTRVPIAGT